MSPASADKRSDVHRRRPSPAPSTLLIRQDGHTAPIEKEIRALSAALEAVKDEQEYIVVRERLHRDSPSALAVFR